MAFVKVQDKDFDSALRKFKKKVLDEGIIEECRRREYFMSKSEKREYKHKENIKRIKRAQKKKFTFKYDN